MTDSEALAESLKGLSTEGADPKFAGIDEMSTARLAAVMNAADAEVPRAIAERLDVIAAAIDAVAERMERGGRLRYVGAGTAGRMAVVDASECPPTFSTPPELVRTVLAGGGAAMTNAVEGAEDDARAGAASMAAHDIGPDDVVVGVTASGRTPFVLAACAEARRRKALTVGLSCNADAELSSVVEHGIEVVVGNEVIAGSTRLKAGTAQKLVLNMISTITMVRLGHTHGNYMVDMRVLNEKLAVRAARMVAEITGAEPGAARAALQHAGNHIKTAVVMIEHDVDADTARRRLAEAGGRLSAALRGLSAPVWKIGCAVPTATATLRQSAGPAATNDRRIDGRCVPMGASRTRARDAHATSIPCSSPPVSLARTVEASAARAHSEPLVMPKHHTRAASFGRGFPEHRSGGRSLDADDLAYEAGVPDWGLEESLMDGPPEGDRWSTWDSREPLQRGPQPHPDWLVTESAAVDHELGILKTGKEADVFLLERAVPGTARSCLLAAKRYRDAEHTMFRRNAEYLEGRGIAKSREARAAARRTRFGRRVIAGQWADAEFTALTRLYRAGASVPYPAQIDGTEILMEFVGEPDGTAAPRLAQTRPAAAERDDLWEQLHHTLSILARDGFAHGDLSAYNLLVQHGRLVLIDVPQVVDVIANPRGARFVERDVRNVGGWFIARGLPPQRVEHLLTDLLREARLA